jgi:putative flippase GtrA
MAKEAFRFIIVGVFGYIIDVSLFNLLMVMPNVSSEAGGPLAPKAFATLVAITFTYWANSTWTFKHRNGDKKNLKQFGQYFIVNIIGLLLILMTLGISHYVLGFQSLLADNISANIIGVGFAAIFRFIANRYWVFPQIRDVSKIDLAKINN